MANFIEPTPIKTLKERKKKIDIYIDRMDKAGCKGDFVDMYKKIQLNFETAINILERARVKTSNDASALPIPDVSKRYCQECGAEITNSEYKILCHRCNYL